jgi:hypothetical protein
MLAHYDSLYRSIGPSCKQVLVRQRVDPYTSYMPLTFTTSKWNDLGIWGFLCWRQCWKLREVSTRFRLCWAIQAMYGAKNGHARFLLLNIEGDWPWDKEDMVDEVWQLAYYLGGDFMMDRMPGDYSVFQHEIAFPAYERIRFRIRCMRSLFPGSRLYEDRLMRWGMGFDPAKFPLFLDSCGLLFVYPKDSKGEKPGHRRFRTLVRLGL